MKLLYKKAIEVLTNQTAKDLFIGKGLVPIKMVDIFRGQYSNPELFQVLTLPAVLFEWSIDHKDNKTIVTIHVITDQVRDTSSLGKQLDKSLAFFDYVFTVNELLCDLESETTGKMELTSEFLAQDDSPSTVYILTYDTIYTGKEVDEADQFNYTDEDIGIALSGVIIKEL